MLKEAQDIGSWQRSFVPTCSERVLKAKERVLKVPEICLERAYAEMKAYEQYKDKPRIIQRARFLETYLREKSIFILDDELIVGNISSKIRSSLIDSSRCGFVDKELDDPVKDPEVRQFDKHIIHPEERKRLRGEILPYFREKNLGNYNLEQVDAEVKEKALLTTASCPHIPNFGDPSMDRDIGHQTANYEKVLLKGLRGIRADVESYLTELDQPYLHYGLEEKRDFYQSVLIVLDAAIAYSRRYAELARQMSKKESNPVRKQELEHIAETCDWVPEYPARNWREALQSVWMTHVIVFCELSGGIHQFSRFDQYMYPFYKKTVLEEKIMTPEAALELLEFFFIKINEYTELRPYTAAIYTTGQSLSEALIIGGQTRDGKDACNEVTTLVLEAEQQLGMIQPETAFRIWEGTPDKYLKKAAEVIRLGRGKPKFLGDRKGIQMVSKSYSDLTIKDWREYTCVGCTEISLPHITMGHLYEGVFVAPKALELTLSNGKCLLCGRQIGPLTGDPKTFQSIAAVKEALRQQIFYWMKYLVKAIKVLKEGQVLWYPAPFCSSLSEGPIQKGLPIDRGGAIYTLYGVFLAGVADTADSLGVIDKLIYRDKKIGWPELLKALKANWEGYEPLRQLCINGVPKYGNDIDFADDWAAWIMDTWYDCVDWINNQKDLLPPWGGKYAGATMVGVDTVGHGYRVGALPNGRRNPNPLAETLSPVQGVDKNGPTAVIRSVSKLPTHRFALGGPINIRLSPQLFVDKNGLDNLVALLRAAEASGIYHIQFNVVSSELLRKAMNDPEKYKDLVVRVASYVAYFTELARDQQLDIINRSEHQGW